MMSLILKSEIQLLRHRYTLQYTPSLLHIYDWIISLVIHSYHVTKETHTDEQDCADTIHKTRLHHLRRWPHSRPDWQGYLILSSSSDHLNLHMCLSSKVPCGLDIVKCHESPFTTPFTSDWKLFDYKRCWHCIRRETGGFRGGAKKYRVGD